MDAELLMSELVEYGFQHVDFVYEPGEFSVRGGIVDVFTYGNEWPYRVELFDTEIESIRLFDPVNQLSRERVESISIVPDIQQKVDQEDWASFFTLIRNDAVLWYINQPLFRARLDMTYEMIQGFRPEIVKSDFSPDVVSFFENEKYFTPEEVISELEEFGGLFFEDGFKLDLSAESREKFNIRPQPSFNKNFSLLIEDLRGHYADGYELFLFTDSARQSRRLDSIFTDLEAGVPIQTILTGLSEGFVDHDKKIVCYTDHQILQRFHNYNLRKGFNKSKAMSARMMREL